MLCLVEGQPWGRLRELYEAKVETDGEIIADRHAPDAALSALRGSQKKRIRFAVTECHKAIDRACTRLGIARFAHHDLRHLFRHSAIDQLESRKSGLLPFTSSRASLTLLMRLFCCSLGN